MTTGQDAPSSSPARRTPAKRKARQLARHLRGERPDYAYLKEVLRHLRVELDIEVARAPKTLPYVPTEAEIRAYYDTVWTARRTGDIVLIKTLLYTGVRVAELVAIRRDEVDLDACRIRITHGKGDKDRYVPFPGSFKETLALHLDAGKDKGATFLFDSSWKKPYSTRGVRAMLARYAASRAQPQHAAAPAAALPVHLAQDPRHRRRAHPALLRARVAHQPGDLQPPRPSPTPKPATTASSTSSPCSGTITPPTGRPLPGRTRSFAAYGRHLHDTPRRNVDGLAVDRRHGGSSDDQGRPVRRPVTGPVPQGDR